MTTDEKSTSIIRLTSTATIATFGDNSKSPYKISYQKGQNCRDRAREIDTATGNKTTRVEIVRREELAFKEKGLCRSATQVERICII